MLKHIFLIYYLLPFGLFAQTIQSGMDWVPDINNPNITSPTYSTASCSGISYTISAESYGIRAYDSFPPYTNSSIIIPYDVNNAATQITVNISFNQTVQNVKLRILDLDENQFTTFSDPEESISNINPIPSAVSPISGQSSFFWTGSDITSDDGNSMNSNNNSAGLLSWSGEIDQISFIYHRPATLMGLVIDSIFFDCVDCSIDLGNDTTLCIGESLELNAQTLAAGSSFTWSDNTHGPTLTVSQPGTYWLESSNGICEDFDTVEVAYVAPPQVDLGPDVAICANEMLTLSVTNPNLSYTWNDHSQGTNLNCLHQGIYWVDADNGVCVSRDSMLLSYLPTPNVDLGNDTSLCNGQSLTLSAAYPGASFLWQDQSTADSLHVTQTGIYSVLASINSCSDTDTLRVNAYQLIDMVVDTTGCIGETIRLEPGINGTYQWQNLSDTNFLDVTQNGHYWVQVSNECGLEKVNYFVHFDVCGCFIYAPNTFTPNADELNQNFEIKYSCDLNYYQLQIYNRWGELLFESYDPDIGWDGSYRDRMVQNGIYVYKLEYNTLQDETKLNFVGHINIIR